MTKVIGHYIIFIFFTSELPRKLIVSMLKKRFRGLSFTIYWLVRYMTDHAKTSGWISAKLGGRI